MRTILKALLLTATAVLLLLIAVLAFFTWQADRREQQTRQNASPPSGQFVRADDLELFVQELGPPQGPAVLFVHGTGAWSELWREPMRALAARGYRAIAIDVPPFGFSEKPSQPRFSTQDQARRIVALVQALGLPGVTLVGHSFGCRATVEAAMQLDDRLRALVLVDAALAITPDLTPAPVSASWASRTADSFFRITPLRHALVASTVTNPLLTKRLFQLLIDDPADATDALVATLQRPFVVQESTNRLGEWLQVFLFGDEGLARSSRPESYRAFAAPTLLLWGERDQLTPVALAQSLNSLLPDSTLVLLKGVGHIPQIEDAAQFTEELLRFLSAQVPVG